MTDFVKCMFQEQGAVFSIGLILLSAACIIILVFLIVVIGKHLWWSIRKPRTDWKFALGKDDTKFKVDGPAAMVAGMLLCAIAGVVIGGGVWYAYLEYGQQYAPSIDSPTVPVTLAEIRSEFQPYTRTTIHIDPKVSDIKVTGQYSGLCVPDLVMSICRQYSADLECKAGWFDRSVEVLPSD